MSSELEGAFCLVRCESCFKVGKTCELISMQCKKGISVLWCCVLLSNILSNEREKYH